MGGKSSPILFWSGVIILSVIVIAAIIYFVAPIIKASAEKVAIRDKCLNETATKYCLEHNSTFVDFGLESQGYMYNLFYCLPINLDKHIPDEKTNTFRFTEEELKKCGVEE